MAKKPSNRLMDALADIPTNLMGGKPSWDDKMQQDFPDEYQQMMEIVNDFRKGGPALIKLRSATRLYDFLVDNNALPIPVSDCTFRRWFSRLKD